MNTILYPKSWEEEGVSIYSIDWAKHSLMKKNIPNKIETKVSRSNANKQKKKINYAI